MIRFDLELTRGDFALSVRMETAARVSGLFGPTGSGKTTVLLALAGLLRPRTGRIEVGGSVLFDSTRGISVSPEKRRMGVVFQDGRLFPHLTVSENLSFSRPPRTARGPSRDEVIHLLDLEPLLERPVTGISGGQARLVAVGRALLARPRILLLDEPMTGLDAERRRRVLAYLLRLKESLDIRILLVSHVLSDFLALADEAAVLDGGRLVRVVEPVELLGLDTASVGREPVETVLRGSVIETESHRAVVDCRGTRLELSLPAARLGDEAVITVAAHDVLVSVGPAPVTSARNHLEGTVVDIRRSGPRVLVGVDAGPLFWAEVTEPSVARLDLAPGLRVGLLIKASALRGVVIAPGR